MGEITYILEPKITTSVLGMAIGRRHKGNGSVVVVHASHGGVSKVGRFSCDSTWLRPPDTQKATLQTLNRELRAACPLSRICMSQRNETIASRMTL